jgi:hydrogenase nickel incorporation protein HypA/HybF
MHELSIAQSIVDIVHQYVPGGNCQSVKTVRVLVGELAGVVPDSLSFCFEAVTADTSLQGASLELEHVPFELRCRPCGLTFKSHEGIVLCPFCEGSDTQVIAGTELRVLDIELLDEPVRAT